MPLNFGNTSSGVKKEESPESIVFDWNADKITLRFAEVNAYYLAYNGKQSYNPHFYLHKVVKPLEKRVTQGEKTEELYNAVMSLEMKPPLAPGCKAPVNNVPPGTGGYQPPR